MALYNLYMFTNTPVGVLISFIILIVLIYTKNVRSSKRHEFAHPHSGSEIFKTLKGCLQMSSIRRIAQSADSSIHIKCLFVQININSSHAAININCKLNGLTNFITSIYYAFLCFGAITTLLEDYLRQAGNYYYFSGPHSMSHMQWHQIILELFGRNADLLVQGMLFALPCFLLRLYAKHLQGSVSNAVVNTLEYQLKVTSQQNERKSENSSKIDVHI